MDDLNVAALQADVIKELMRQKLRLERGDISLEVIWETVRDMSRRWEQQTEGLTSTFKQCSAVGEFKKIICWLDSYFEKAATYSRQTDLQLGAVDFAGLAVSTLNDMLTSLGLWEKQFIIEANIVKMKLAVADCSAGCDTVS